MKNQFLWEVWFYTSTSLFAFMFILGTLDGSKEFLPNYLWYFGASFINVMACIIIGLIKR